jgi:hypothetical protein
MKQTIKMLAYVAVALSLSLMACKKKKKDPEPEPAPVTPPANDPEVITTLRIYIWDSITNTAIAGSPFSFKDPDGDGGIAGGFLNNGADSVITLTANTTYKTRVIILDETKNPVDSTSNDVGIDEGWEHMFFYNGNPANSGNNNGNTILVSGYPNYTVKLNGSNIRIRYTDADNGVANGKPTRNIGLQTYLKTSSATSIKYPFITTLRHQPGEKDGTYAPGETDVEVTFKVKVN